MLFCGGTDKGLKRETNQDDFSVFSLGESLVVAVLCDGMGGANGGTVASSTAVKAIEEHIRKVDMRSFSPRNIKSILQSAVYAANARVFDKACNDDTLYGMGTTVVAAIVHEDTAYIVHAGDSRAYICNTAEKNIHQITRDHSIVQDLVESGQLTSEEAQHHPKRNVITRAVGVREEILIDYNEVVLSNSDILLLCSDGLSNFVDNDSITKILCENSADKCPQKLIALANNNGGGDNITSVIITDFESSERRES